MSQQKYVLPQGFPEVNHGLPPVHVPQAYPQVVQGQPGVGMHQQPLITTQPQAMQQSTMVVQTGGRNRVYREWTTGMMDCCSDMGSCCGVLFCPMCYLMLLSTEMRESCCVPCCVPCPHMVLRVKLRSMEKIRGNIMNDCCVSTCCAFCVVCQVKREWQNVQKVKSGVNMGAAF